MLSAILSHLGTDQLDWSKNWLLVPLYTLATIGVVLGVYWESEKFTSSKQKRGKKLLLFSLLVEVIAGFSILETDAIISASQQSEIIALRKAAAPRNIWGDDIRKVADAVRKFSGVKYDLSIPPMVNGPYSLDVLEPGSYLVGQLIRSLRRGGWELQSINGDIPKAVLPWTIAWSVVDPSTIPKGRSVPIPTILVGQVTGVIGVKVGFKFLQNSTKPVSDGALALIKVLNDIGIRADEDLEPNDSKLAPNMVHITIGTKP